MNIENIKDYYDNLFLYGSSMTDLLATIFWILMIFSCPRFLPQWLNNIPALSPHHLPLLPLHHPPHPVQHPLPLLQPATHLPATRWHIFKTFKILYDLQKSNLKIFCFKKFDQSRDKSKVLKAELAEPFLQ